MEQSRFRSSLVILLHKAIAGLWSETEFERGWLISGSIFIKEIPLKMNRQNKSKIVKSTLILLGKSFKNESDQKKVHQKIKIALDYMTNPFKIYSDK